MNKYKPDSILIEYILNLLNNNEINNIENIEQLVNNSNQKKSYSKLHLKNIKKLYEITKFMDEIPGGFFIYHADGNQDIIYANKSMLRIFKCDTMSEFKKLTGNSFLGLVYPEDLEEVEKSIEEQISHSQYDLDYVEYRITRKDGEIRWVEDYGHFIQSQTLGNIFYTFIADATEKKNRHLMEKKQNEQKLQNLIEEYDKEKKLINQEYLRRLEVIEGLSINYDSILYADLDKDEILPYRLSDRNKQYFEKQFQTHKFSCYISDYINTWVHPEDHEIVFKFTSPKYIREKLSTTKTYYINYRVINNEEIQCLQLRIVNVNNKDNHISQIVLGYHRVDEEIRHEIEQNQLLEEALNNANLAIVAKNTFLSNMSHDMRTPLNAIFGFTSLAKKNINDSQAVQTYLNKIETSSHQLLELIDKVLELSWTKSNNDICIEETECNLCDIMQETYNFLFPQASEKNITFSLDCTGLEHSNIYSDKEKLKQLLLCLVNNAITYTGYGGKVDIIAKELEKLPNDYANYQFIVEDTGIGISKDFLKHIFEPFQREKNTTFSGIYGIGLGLTISKNIVEMMRGTIEADSTVGKGSKFTVNLSLHIQQNQSSLISTKTDNDNINITNQKILLVEDNEINLEIETEILQELGFSIDTATDGSIALEKLKNANPGDYDLILMDIQMPIMDGWKTTKNIRKLKNPILACIPIIALSANAFESDKRTSIESGMNAHLAKPIDIPLLLETITKITQKHKN